MPHTVVQYRCTSPETADENQRLVEDVFSELEATGATGFSYASFRLEDGVSFVHVVVEHAEQGTDLSSVPAFQRFVAGIDRRVDAAPVVRGAQLVGAHRMFEPG